MAEEAGRRRLGRLSRVSLRARLTLLLAGVAAFLLVTLGVQLAFQARLADERDDLIHRVDRSAEVAGDLRTAVADQQSGVRGYLLAGERRFLEPYEQGRRAADRSIDELGTLLADSPALADELDGVRTALSRWQRLTAEPAVDPVTRRALMDDPQRTEAFLDESAARFDDLRDRIDTLDNGLEDERSASVDNLDSIFNTLVVAMVLQVAGLVVLGAVIALALSRQVLTPLARLRHQARLVAAGDLDRAVRVDGPPELVRLGEDVEAMRARIVAELAELSAARAELWQQAVELARSNADLEQFAYVASHDLQEPLRKVYGFCQLLERRYGDQLDDRAKEYIWYAADGAKRMQALINDLLAFSRAGRTTEAFRPVDLNRVVAEALDAFDDAIVASGATVTVADLPEVDGDAGLLGAVFQNLLGNAVKFRSDQPPRVDVTASCQNDEWTIKVSDNGIGVDPLYADQIFTLFGRLHHKSDYAGTGIGLALSKKIVEFHGGRIWLETTDEQGATFAFTLPARSRDVAPPTRGESADDAQ
jgi:signal transduction histidine kinase